MNNSNKRGVSRGIGRGFYLLLAAIAVAGVAALVWLGRAGGDDRDSRPLSVAEMSVEADSSAGVPLGPADAPVTIMEFGDFQCPFCKRFNGFTGTLIRQNYANASGGLRWIAYDFPLDQHGNALMAALAGRCAEEQGGFWPMHDLLFSRQDEWVPDRTPLDKFADYAGRIGLDSKKLESCVKARTYLPSVLASRRYGDQLGVRATPTLFVNGRKLDGVPSYEQLASLIRQAVTAAASGADSGGAVAPATAGNG